METLEGVDLLIHAGDIGRPDVIDNLRSIARVVAVRGNIDRESWADRFSETETVQVGNVQLLLVHNIGDLDLDPGAAGYRAVISGHSHRPSVRERNGVLFVNPGSAGPRRFKQPVTLARIRVKGTSLRAKIVELDV
jgi:hypothetical protein